MNEDENEVRQKEPLLSTAKRKESEIWRHSLQSDISALESIAFHEDTNYPTFVEEIPKIHECPLCRKILQSPVSTECGHRFCEKCLMDYKSTVDDPSMVTCPVAEEDCAMLTHTYPDYSTKREIQLLMVYCSNKAYGCNAVMAWGHLAKHLRGCEFQRQPCRYQDEGCMEMLANSERSNHETQCQFRPITCSLCRRTAAQSKMKQHQELECEEARVSCEFGCGEVILIMDRENHEEQCPKRRRNCMYHDMGCEFVGDKQEMEQHYAQDLSQHVEFVRKMAVKNSRTIDDIKSTSVQTQSNHFDDYREEVNALRRTVTEILKGQTTLREEAEIQRKSHQEHITRLNEQVTAITEANTQLIRMTEQQALTINILEKQVHEMRRETSTSVSIMRTLKFKVEDHLANPNEHILDGVLLWKIDDYPNLKQNAVIGTTTSICSKPFYSDRLGYKMHVRLYPNGDGLGKGSHVSLFFAIMKGEYDSILQWPFMKKIIFTLLDQSGSEDHHTDGFVSDSSSTSFKRPTGSLNIATGCPLFIRQSTLESGKYLKEDAIYIKVDVLDNDD